MDNLIEQFNFFALMHQQGTKSGNHKKTNKAYDNLVETFNQIKLQENWIDKFQDLLNDADPSILLWSATCLYNHLEDKGRVFEALERAAKNDNGLVGFSAETTLKQLKSGWKPNF